ncbi:MAG: hypothetical protein QM687_14120 [Ferruginibacter sp.]
MKLTNLFKATMVALCITVATPYNSNATNNHVVSTKAPEDPAAMLARITARVAEIEKMDKTSLTTSEKRALRKELKGMHKDAAGLDNKVYISVGAIIIAILLLLLILT